MKCIKAVKSLKNYEIGDVVRINNVEAEEKVRTGYWQYASKSEWKTKVNSKVQTQSEKNDESVPKMKAPEKNTKKTQKEKYKK
jgi:hypothetical protein